MDLHTTNGSYHGYALTWSPGLNPNRTPANDVGAGHRAPRRCATRVRARHRRRDLSRTATSRNQDPDSLATAGWWTYESVPRFGTRT
jgi:hypothetical protein